MLTSGQITQYQCTLNHTTWLMMVHNVVMVGQSSSIQVVFSSV